MYVHALNSFLVCVSDTSSPARPGCFYEDDRPESTKTLGLLKANPILKTTITRVSLY